jgi:hypothetical protein
VSRRAFVGGAAAAGLTPLLAACGAAQTGAGDTAGAA